MKVFFIKCQINYEIYDYILKLERQDHPDFSILSDGLFWDTSKENINWQRNKKWVIRRVFEYGNEQEILEIIRYYGKSVIKDIMLTVKSTWHNEIRNINLQKYVS